MAAVRALTISRTTNPALLARSLDLGSSTPSRFLHHIFRFPPSQHRIHFSVVALYPASSSSSSSSSSSPSVVLEDDPSLASSLLHRLRIRQLVDLRNSPRNVKEAQVKKKVAPSSAPPEPAFTLATSFRGLPLSDELLSAVDELGISQPTEVQCRSIPAVLDGQNVVIASHTGSGKTLAYMIPLVQLLRKDEIEHNATSRPRRPRAVVLCPTRELAEQVYRVAKSICHHAKFRATLIGGGVRMRPQEDALNAPIDMLVGTPGRLLMHVEDGNMAYGDIKYVVLDEADTMFDRGFGPEIKKFLGPLRNRSLKAGNAGFQTILVTATITQGVQNLLNDEFPGIKHIRTATLHKKVSSARHGFIKLSGTENKLESLLQVLEPSLSKRERVMVFCNTLNSCRAVDHFLNENNIPTVNYHGAVPADERVEVLNKFKNEGGKCPALVCTDLAARGLDLVVDHVIMFDFPLNSIDYLHRTGRTARMGARGKVTSLVAKRDIALAEQIEVAIQKGQALDAISVIKKEASEAKKQAVRAKPKEAGRVGRLATEKRKRPAQPNVSTSGSARKAATRTGAGSKPTVSKSAKRASGVKISRVGSSAKPIERKMAKRTGQKVMKLSSKR